MKSPRGFTLIELMIVIAIIAILASIAITAYANSIAKAQLSEAFSVTDGLKADVSNYYTENGTCPTLGSGGFVAGSSYSGRYVASVSITGAAPSCVITALMRSGTIARKLQGKNVTLTMTKFGGTVIWQCTSNVDPVYLPTACQ